MFNLLDIFSKSMTAVLILFLAVLIWARFIEPHLIKIEKVSLSLDRFPKRLRIVQLSDFQSKRIGWKEKKVLSMVNDLNPDYLVITGDIVGWRTKDPDQLLSYWQDLVKGREGKVFVVFGNHEHRNPGFKEIARLFKEAGFRVLINESVRIEKDNQAFFLIGVDDPHLGFDRIELGLEGVPDQAPKIVLAHSPEIFRKIRDESIDLVLTGHTHGCQIDIPFAPFTCDFILPVAYDKQYKQGLFQEKGTYLYVNRGLGETFLPLRFNCLPEITLIEINND
jgi:hypothetical protein